MADEAHISRETASILQNAPAPQCHTPLRCLKERRTDSANSVIFPSPHHESPRVQLRSAEGVGYELFFHTAKGRQLPLSRACLLACLLACLPFRLRACLMYGGLDGPLACLLAWGCECTQAHPGPTGSLCLCLSLFLCLSVSFFHHVSLSVLCSGLEAWAVTHAPHESALAQPPFFSLLLLLGKDQPPFWVMGLAVRGTVFIRTGAPFSS